MQQGPTPQPPVVVVAPAAPIAARATPSPSAIYEGFQAQRSVLSDQLNELEDTRRGITNQLQQVSTDSPERKPLEDRLVDVDTRIKAVDQMLAGNAAQLAQAAAIPGAVVERPPEVRQGPPEEAFVLGGLFMILVFFPLSVALARRIWKRSATVITSLPRELSERLARLEQATESTALEVERIGEGQRFLTKLFTDGEAARALGSGAAQPVESKLPNSRERRP